MRKTVRLSYVVVLLSLLFSASGCTFLIGGTSAFVPIPDDVRLQEIPEILGCSAEFVLRSCNESYERVCGWFCWDEDEEEWDYCCWTAWAHTDCWGDIVIQLTVRDPSDDLNQSKSPRVRVLDPRPVAGAWDTCLFDVTQTDIPITSTDIAQGGPVKTVTVRLRNVHVRFTRDCRTFVAELPLRVLFNVDGQELLSANECSVRVEYDR
ncbi:MAG: hypothetical protein WBC63_05180 [Candidatus Bipolaricaulia bacterium]